MEVSMTEKTISDEARLRVLMELAVRSEGHGKPDTLVVASDIAFLRGLEGAVILMDGVQYGDEAYCIRIRYAGHIFTYASLLPDAKRKHEQAVADRTMPPGVPN
jgi:hypothetical protein